MSNPPQGSLADLASRRRYPPVEIRDGLVYKRGEAPVLEMEALKMGLAAVVGERCGCFWVPQVRRLDLPGEMLVIEHIPQLLNLHQIAVGRSVQPEPVFQAAGRALATVHRELRLPADRIVPLPDYLRSEREDEVAVHGDFCCNNVCYHGSTARIVLLDWSTAPLLGTTANFGSRYFDLVWFAWSLFFWMPPGRVLGWRPEHLMRALAAGYAEVENRFQWERYVRYRWLMRHLPRQYWKGKCAVAPSGLLASGAQLLGWLWWRCFPWCGLGKRTHSARVLSETVSEGL